MQHEAPAHMLKCETCPLLSKLRLIKLKLASHGSQPSLGFPNILKGKEDLGWRRKSWKRCLVHSLLMEQKEGHPWHCFDREKVREVFGHLQRGSQRLQMPGLDRPETFSHPTHITKSGRMRLEV